MAVLGAWGGWKEMAVTTVRWQEGTVEWSGPRKRQLLPEAEGEEIKYPRKKKKTTDYDVQGWIGISHRTQRPGDRSVLNRWTGPLREDLVAI